MGSDGWWDLRLVEHGANLGCYPARDRAFRLRDERAAAGPTGITPTHTGCNRSWRRVSGPMQLEGCPHDR